MAQYYQFLRLGRAGYTKIMQNCHAVAMFLQKAIEDTGYFTIISARDPVPMLPLATFSLKPNFRLNGCALAALILCLDKNRAVANLWATPAQVQAWHVHVRWLHVLTCGREVPSPGQISALPSDDLCMI